ncbi:MAG: hypothetical protein [Bacteriophage sp.]|nr:MAG: hypothetical protein [Bacteriophage sp.]
MTLQNDVLKTAVRPALAQLEPLIQYSPVAHALVIGTGLVESQYNALLQGGGGPALGFWQMEPATYNDIVKNFIMYREGLATKISSIVGYEITGRSQRLATDNLLAAIMCRIQYYRSKSALPPMDAKALSSYHKNVYNTALGAADPLKNVPAFQRAIDLVTANS